MSLCNVSVFWCAHSSCAAYSYKVVRGTLDFSGVVGRVTARSKYGGMLHTRWHPVWFTWLNTITTSKKTKAIVMSSLLLANTSRCSTFHSNGFTVH